MAEPRGAFGALVAIGIALDRAAVLIDVLDRFGGDAPGRSRIAPQRPHAPAGLPNRGGHAASLEHAAHAARRVGAAAETEQVDAVAGLPDADDLGVAVDDVLGDAEAGRLAHEVVEAPQPGDLDGIAVAARAEARVVEGQLQRGVDAVVGGDAGGAEELVDVAARLVGHEAAGLAGAVREDQDILAHLRLPLASPTRPAQSCDSLAAVRGETAQGAATCKAGEGCHPQGRRCAPQGRRCRRWER